MEKDRVQKYAESLERIIQNNHHYLKETIEDFQEMCRLVTPERNIPQGIIVDIREVYKEIQNRLKEIKAIQQLLQGKYRMYYHRDSLRDKDIMEFGFIAKNCYSKFEYTLMQIEAKKKLEEREHLYRKEHLIEPLRWFRSKENQIALLRNLRILNELDYETPSDSGAEEKREVIQNQPRSLTLFIFTGEERFINDLQSQIQLREHDVIERYGRGEIRGVLTHLRKIHPSEAEQLFQRFMEAKGFSNLKCLLLPIHSRKDLEGPLWDRIKTTLQEMAEGEVRRLSI
ncbi:MAG: hypothetical protein AB1502_00675 [Thermodesulfobacteriota bacterium]